MKVLILFFIVMLWYPLFCAMDKAAKALEIIASPPAYEYQVNIDNAGTHIYSNGLHIGTVKYGQCQALDSIFNADNQ